MTTGAAHAPHGQPSCQRQVLGFLSVALLLFFSGCGGAELANGETSVFLTVRNGPGAPTPFEIGIFPSAYGGTLGDAGVSTLYPLWVRVNVDAGGAELGTLAIAAPPQGGNTMVIRGQGRDRTGRVISTGEATARIVRGKQSRATLILTAAAAQDSDGGRDGGPGLDAVADSAGGPTDALDAARDAPAVAGKLAGEPCANGSECASGTCKDSVCCDRPCPGLCRTCRPQGLPPGTCVELAEGTVCRNSECRAANMMPNGLLATFRCDADGNCQTSIEICVNRVCNASNDTCL